ncbi:MAG: ATP-binding domain-containing protein, partial [Dehalococcoidales bacterium]|nr:ATP-binding domain-containing protein [Dehalococcoidales bacterium]
QSRALEEAFVRFGTAYKLVAGTRFYERREVKDIIAYLRLIQNPDDSVSLLRIINVPGRGVGKQTLAKLSSLARSLGVSQYEALRRLDGLKDSEEPPFTPQATRALLAFTEVMEELIARSREVGAVELLDLVVKRTGYQEYLLAQPDGEERWDNILELRTVAQQYRDLPPPEGLTAFLEGVTLVSDVDGLDETVDAATLITLHQAKGLEFPVVFIVGVEEGILPHIRSFDDPGQMEEERRLCYVGITRAKRRVYLVHAFRRNFRGSSNVSQPSRFLDDIPRHLVSGSSLWAGEDKKVASAVYSWNRSPAFSPPPHEGVVLPEVKAGSRVRHAVFGEGVVVSSRAVDGDYEAVVAFEGAGVKRLLLSFARLEKVE